MRFTEKQYQELLRRGKDRSFESDFPAVNDDLNLEKLEQDRQERAKFRKHVRRGDYQFCDSYFLEKQDVDGVNK